jgi:hypothetical protein
MNVFRVEAAAGSIRLNEPGNRKDTPVTVLALATGARFLLRPIQPIRGGPAAAEQWSGPVGADPRTGCRSGECRTASAADQARCALRLRPER